MKLKLSMCPVFSFILISIILVLGVVGCSGHREKSGMNKQPITPLMRGTLWWVRGQEMEEQWQKSDFDNEIRLHREVGFDLLWVFGTPELMQAAIANQERGQSRDVMRMILEIADEIVVGVPKSS